MPENRPGTRQLSGEIVDVPAFANRTNGKRNHFLLGVAKHVIQGAVVEHLSFEKNTHFHNVAADRITGLQYWKVPVAG